MGLIGVVDSGIWWFGLVATATVMVRGVLWGYHHFYRPKVNLAQRYGDPTRPENAPSQEETNTSSHHVGWAVVTGGSSGIGFEMAVRLLTEGFAVAVVALPHEERAVIRRLKTRGFELLIHNKRCVFIGVDAGEGAAAATEVRDELLNRISSGQFRLLAHCIGAPSATPQPLWRHSAESVQRLVNVNLAFAAALTAAMLPELVKGVGRKGLVFMSSQAGAMPSAPLIASYGAAKAGLVSLAGSLAVELAHHHPEIDVIAAIPGRTLAGATLNWWGADSAWAPGSFASALRVATNTLDHLDAGPVVSPYWVHSLQLAATWCVPNELLGELVYRDLASATPTEPEE
eukprot:m.28781 g.28781  ORF g.28781 m.28781 type:complete len:344 (+) comp6595_c0_seq1:871-1902(+)